MGSKTISGSQTFIFYRSLHPTKSAIVSRTTPSTSLTKSFSKVSTSATLERSPEKTKPSKSSILKTFLNLLKNKKDKKLKRTDSKRKEFTSLCLGIHLSLRYKSPTLECSVSDKNKDVWRLVLLSTERDVLILASF